jgi:hypothetical protein
MTQQITLNYFTDPGHGWIEAPIQLLKQLGIVNKITSYSYRKGDTAFLEEDCDSALLLMELTKHDVKYDVIEHHTNNDSKIRNYHSYYA